MSWREQALPSSRSDVGQSEWPIGSFLDADHAWVAELSQHDGRVVLARTSDGNASLRVSSLAATPDSYGISMSFVDPSHGYLGVMTNNLGQGTLFRTDDGGSTWAVVNTKAPVAGLDFQSDRDGWATGNGLYRTADGGRSWRRLHPPGWQPGSSASPVDPTYRIVRASQQGAVIELGHSLGMSSAITWLVTTDAASWRDVTPAGMGMVNNTGPQPWLTTSGPAGLRIVTPAGYAPSAPAMSTLLVSDDLGRTFHHVATPYAMHDPQAFFSGDSGWVYDGPQNLCPSPDCADSSVWSTTDGGRSWHQLAFPPTS